MIHWIFSYHTQWRFLRNTSFVDLLNNVYKNVVSIERFSLTRKIYCSNKFLYSLCPKFISFLSTEIFSQLGIEIVWYKWVRSQNWSIKRAGRRCILWRDYRHCWWINHRRWQNILSHSRVSATSIRRYCHILFSRLGQSSRLCRNFFAALGNCSRCWLPRCLIEKFDRRCVCQDLCHRYCFRFWRWTWQSVAFPLRQRLLAKILCWAKPLRLMFPRLYHCRYHLRVWHLRRIYWWATSGYLLFWGLSTRFLLCHFRCCCPVRRHRIGQLSRLVYKNKRQACQKNL